MSIEAKKGNFEFVKEIYPDLYVGIAEAERNAFINFKAVGSTLRNVLEEWLTKLVNEYGLVPNVSGRVSLNDKRKMLNDAGKLPRLSDYKYISVEGKKKSLNGYLVWQKYGNQCSHPEKTSSDPDIIYFNVEAVLRIIHKVFRLEYVRKKGSAAAQKIESFNPFIMPIGDNYVVSSNVPIDKPVSNCIREYETCSYDEMGRIDKYGIVRVFEKKDMDEKLLQLRDKEAFSEAASEAGIQFDGNVQIDVLSKMSSISSNYYIVIYKFSRRPLHVNDTLLESLTKEERETLCAEITRIIVNFHSLSIPIYHRNITFDSICVCKNRNNKYEPTVIKLDCAKIASDEFGTVITNVENTQTLLQQQKLMKYTAPEVRVMMKNRNLKVDWEKADIYSLGVLYADILNGKIESVIIPSFKLQRKGVKVQLLQLIDRMRNPNPNLRPTAETVMHAFAEMN